MNEYGWETGRTSGAVFPLVGDKEQGFPSPGESDDELTALFVGDFAVCLRTRHPAFILANYKDVTGGESLAPLK